MIWWMFDYVCCSLPQMVVRWCYNNLQKLNIVIFIEKSFPMKLLRLQHQLNRMFVFVSVCSWDQIYRHHRIKRLRTTTRTEHFVPCNHQMKDTHTHTESFANTQGHSQAQPSYSILDTVIVKAVSSAVSFSQMVRISFEGAWQWKLKCLTHLSTWMGEFISVV